MLDQPGEYNIGECDELTIEGQNIEVIADEVGALTIRGNDIDVDAPSIGIVRIEGQSSRGRER